MRTRGLLFLFLAVVGLGLVATLPTGAAEKVDAGKINQLIEQLGSNDFAERERAYSALDGIGAPALDALRKALKSDDAEVRRRADELVVKLEKIAEREKILKPTMVRLNYKDRPLPEAIEDVRAKTGLQIYLHDPENKLVGRKITLDTGEKPLWQAFDQFCEKAGLAEGDPNQIGTPVGPRPTATGVVPTLPVVPPAPLPAPVPAVVPAKPAFAPAKDVKKEKEPAKDSKEDKKEPAKSEKPKEEPAPAKPAPAAKAPAPAAALQLQVELPGVPAGGPGIGPRMPAPGQPGWNPYAPNQVILVDARPKSLPVDYAGAVRIRALPPGTVLSAAKVDREVLVGLGITPEPRLAFQSILGVTIEKALDDQGQSLMQAIPNAGENGDDVLVGPGGVIMGRARIAGRYSSGVGINQVAVRLQKGEKPSKALKELKGTITAQVRTAPVEVLAVEKLLQAKGETAKADGGSLKIVDVVKAEDGTVTVEVKLDMPAGVQAVNPGTVNGPNGVTTAPAIIFPPAGGGPGVRRPLYMGGFNGLAVYDAKGNRLGMSLVKNGGVRVGLGAGVNQTAEYTFLVVPQKDQGEPAKLSFTGSRVQGVDIPFTLKDIPLP